MSLLFRLTLFISLLASLPFAAHAQLEELGEAGESDFNPVNPKPNYRQKAVGWQKNVPPDSSRIRYSVFLIGDVGNPIPAAKGGEPSLNFMRKQMLQMGANSSVVFLGDNIYNQGMPPEGAYDRKIAEGRLNTQLDILKGYKGEKYMTPGNHDWIQGSANGLAQVNREQSYSEHYLPKTPPRFRTPATSWCPAMAAPAPTRFRCAMTW